MAAENTRSMRKSHVTYRAADGIPIPGTTTIVGLRSKDLTGWAFNMGKQHPELNSLRDYVDDLARIGSLVHHYAESRLKGIEPEIDDWTPNEVKAADGARNKFDEWMKNKTLTNVTSEKQLISEKYRFGGTIDIYAVVDGVPCLIDIKTGRAVYREYFYQTSAYAELLKENGYPVEEVRILRLGRVGSEGFEERVLKDWSLYWDAFLAMRSLYSIEKSIDRFEAAGGL